MNRRSFLQRLSAGIVGAAAVAHIPASWIPAPITRAAIPITFKGVPLVFDKYAESTSVYFVTCKIDYLPNNPRRLGVLKDIGA